jgi:predicted dehydrogenase
MDRRQFLKSSGAGVALSGLNSYAAALADSKRRRVGLIGCGWYGKIDLIRLIQVAPVEVVSLCDVDKQTLQQAGEIIGHRQDSKKTPRLFSDYRQMLAEKDLDLVLIDPPDHWHPLIMIEAAKSGVDVWVQKPISVDVVEGQAMLAAARKYGRVVQVGTQRRSTPHIVEARDRFIKTGMLGKVALVEVYCYYHMRATAHPPDSTPPAHLDYDTWTGPAPMQPYNSLIGPRTWRAFMQYGNGIMGDMCIHMFDMTRWMLDLGWPTRISSTGGIFVDKKSRANISDTQTATWDFEDLRVVWQHRTWGEANDPKHPWGATYYGDKGTLKVDVYGYDFTPLGGQTIHRDVTYEYEKYPEDRTEKDLERHVAPAIRYHMLNFLQAIDERSKPVADIEQGYISTASCILANNAMQLGRTIQWDGGRQQAIGDQEANRLLRRTYRQPWQHPDPQSV